MVAITSVLIQVALEAEAQPMIDSLELVEDKPSAIPCPLPARTYSGAVNGLKVHLVANGKDKATGMDNVGTVPAALTAYLAALHLKPDLVISVGTAGGFRARGGEIGDVYLSTAVANHDRHIPIPGFDKYGVSFTSTLPTPKLQKALGIKAGVVSSGNSLTYSEADLAQLTALEAVVKEMEASGVVWGCELLGIPFMALKSITDIVDGDKPTHEEFLENLHMAVKSLTETVVRALDFIAGRGLEEL